MITELTRGFETLLSATGLLYLALTLAILVAAAAGFRWIFKSYVRFRGTRIVKCPENCATVAVEVDAPHAAFTGLGGKPELRLQECTRWPEKAGCGQMCLSQIEDSPEGCLLKNILTVWYEGKSCVFCGLALGEINWLEHKPALRSPEGKTMLWTEFPPETIYDVLETHQPVCWNCHIAEQFRAEHPELVIDHRR
ncbi:MAG: hypothetical protein ACKV22_28335 [Bryobacteraceae bacterium]